MWNGLIKWQVGLWRSFSRETQDWSWPQFEETVFSWCVSTALRSETQSHFPLPLDPQEQVLSLCSSSFMHLPWWAQPCLWFHPPALVNPRVSSPGPWPIPDFSYALTSSFSWLSDPHLTLNMSNLEFNSTKTSFLHNLIHVNKSQLGSFESSRFFAFLRNLNPSCQWSWGLIL